MQQVCIYFNNIYAIQTEPRGRCVAFKQVHLDFSPGKPERMDKVLC